MTKIVFCADDFTGASDTLATLARAGLNARLYLTAPEPSDDRNDPNKGPDSLDAFGVATSLRAMGVEDGVATIGAIAHKLVGACNGLYHFKICSTFDSSPDTGNIAAIADRYASSVGAKWKAVIGGQPSLRRFCLLGNLFAGAGDGELYRIDRHPVMSVHPVTPMNDADLCRHLGAQGWPKIGLIDFTIIRQGRAALIAEIRRRLAAGETETLFDVSEETDLLTIGEAIREIAKTTAILCVGASSVAEALFPHLSPNTDHPTKLHRRPGPVFAFAGSRSSLTADQVTRACSYVKRSIAPSDLCDPTALEALRAECLSILGDGKHLLVSLSDNRDHTIASHDLARASAAFIAGISHTVKLGFLLIAGGDTSSLALQELGIDSLSFAADFDAGAPIIRAHASLATLDELPMLLKGGQMGKPDLFDNITTLSVSTV
ncbi:MAG: four-carbon acid sugar kinase family protein [Rhodospirillales bacterium]|nr:four-carbon acid sugar kinase family protein [Rhodospirillales bacterium]